MTLSDHAKRDDRQPSAEARLAAVMGWADCIALTPGEAFLTAVVPLERLDDAFTLMGASEDLEGGDINQNPATTSRVTVAWELP